MRPTTLFALAAALPLAACTTADDNTGVADPGELAAEPSPGETEATPDAPPDIAAEPGYYYVRPFIGICDTAPLCGGYIVEPVNRDAITCPDGTRGTECRVVTAETDTPLPPADVALGATDDVIVAGFLTTRDEPDVGPLGHLVVEEIWLGGAAAGEPAGTGVRVIDNGVRCIVAPCPDKDEYVLNTDEVNQIADLDFAPSGATDAEIATAFAALDARGPGLLVVGDTYVVEGPSGATAAGRTVTQFYLPYEEVAIEAAMTIQECADAGGKARSDLGNGTATCLAGEESIGRVTFGTEGGVCCVATP